MLKLPFAKRCRLFLSKIVARLVATLAHMTLGHKFALTALVVLGSSLLLALTLIAQGLVFFGGLALLATLASAYVLGALYLQLSAAIAALASMATRLADGERSVAPMLTTPDALGAVAATLAALVAERTMTALTQQMIVDYAVDGILVIDRTDHVTTFNPAAERIFGYSAAEIVGQSVALIIPDPLHHQYKLISIGGEIIGRRKDATLFPGSYIFSPYSNPPSHPSGAAAR